MSRRILRIFWRVLRDTGAYRILIGYVLFVLVEALLIWMLSPSIKTFGDSLWYCYAVVSTAGFGDVVADGLLARILSILLSVYSVFALAILTGVVVNFYTQVIELRNNETITSFLDKLEHLTELSEEEQHELSEQVKRYRMKRELRR